VKVSLELVFVMFAKPSSVSKLVRSIQKVIGSPREKAPAENGWIESPVGRPNDTKFQQTTTRASNCHSSKLQLVGIFIALIRT